MHAAVIVFPGSNCDRDLAVAFKAVGAKVSMVWHKDTSLPEGVDIVGVPGGFSYGDYLRCGAIAANSPICREVAAHAERGGYVMGICNGFQVLTETGLLPGALLRNAGLKYICRTVPLRVATADSDYTSGYEAGAMIDIPIAHHDGNYFADGDTIAKLHGEDRVAFTYGDNPNGSQSDIAGILSSNRRVLGMMPHPERAADAGHGGTDGAALAAGENGPYESTTMNVVGSGGHPNAQRYGVVGGKVALTLPLDLETADDYRILVHEESTGLTCRSDYFTIANAGEVPTPQPFYACCRAEIEQSLPVARPHAGPRRFRLWKFYLHTPREKTSL